jgi:hypothetical protein
MWLRFLTAFVVFVTAMAPLLAIANNIYRP